MFLKKLNTLFPLNRLLGFLIGLVIGIQIIVILYNHISGYYILNDFLHFLSRLSRGFLLSLPAALLIALADLYVIQFMNDAAPWSNQVIKRIGLQSLFTLCGAACVAILFTLFSHWIKPYEFHSLQSVIISNILIFSVVNVMLIAILEGWILFVEKARAKQMAADLQNELSQINFEVLKSQINPHFMFNSLNVLSGLINKDINKAQQFIDEFSMIYRYVLETIEQPVVTLGREQEFARSYLFLQQIRYGENLTYSINISAELMELYLPPLSLQVVLENALKHNIINESKPLHVDIYNEAQFLIIRNNIQLKFSQGISTGLGLKNLKKRYALISDLVPDFNVDTNHYIAILPLIKIDEDEGVDH